MTVKTRKQKHWGIVLEGGETAFWFYIESKKQTDPGVFYFEGVLKAGNQEHEIFGYYHDRTRPLPHHIWIEHCPTLSSKSAAHWEKKMTHLLTIKDLEND